MTGPGRITVVGGECTGKTTLARALAADLPGEYVEEYLRRFVVEHGRVPTRAEQADVVAGQARTTQEAARRGAGAPWLIVDSGPIMTAVYSRLYYDDDGLDELSLSMVGSDRLVVWCAPEFPWEADPGQRDGAQYRDAAETILGDLLPQCAAPVLRVRGRVSERVMQVRRALTG